tara:strand:+ start:4666 stop:5010 length:345 start_codon:yes stop_codon:yes gene_type:complete
MIPEGSIDELAELNPEALVPEGLDDAFIGYVTTASQKHVAAYCLKTCARIIARENNVSMESALSTMHETTMLLDVEDAPVFVTTSPDILFLSKEVDDEGYFNESDFDDDDPEED